MHLPILSMFQAKFHQFIVFGPWDQWIIFLCPLIVCDCTFLFNIQYSALASGFPRRPGILFSSSLKWGCLWHRTKTDGVWTSKIPILTVPHKQWCCRRRWRFVSSEIWWELNSIHTAFQLKNASGIILVSLQKMHDWLCTCLIADITIVAARVGDYGLIMDVIISHNRRA